MTEDPIKEAFIKVKQDISQIQSQLILLTQEIKELKRTFHQTDKPTDTQTNNQTYQTNDSIHQTQSQYHFSKQPVQAPKPQYSEVSTGNEGVQTDRQTNRQTDRQTPEFDNQQTQQLTDSQGFALSQRPAQIIQNSPIDDPIANIERVSEVLSSLDSIKKELRSKFKKITHQEMLVFSTIYQLEDEGFFVDYSLISSKLSLSESSIRDYVQKLIGKGIPLTKTKENNKRITLSILPNLRKIATLDTIIKLREL